MSSPPILGRTLRVFFPGFYELYKVNLRMGLRLAVCHLVHWFCILKKRKYPCELYSEPRRRHITVEPGWHGCRLAVIGYLWGFVTVVQYFKKIPCISEVLEGESAYRHIFLSPSPIANKTPSFEVEKIVVLSILSGTPRGKKLTGRQNIVKHMGIFYHPQSCLK